MEWKIREYQEVNMIKWVNSTDDIIIKGANRVACLLEEWNEFRNKKIEDVPGLKLNLKDILINDFWLKRIYDLEWINITITFLNINTERLSEEVLKNMWPMFNNLKRFCRHHKIEHTTKSPKGACYQNIVFNEDNRETLETVLSVLWLNDINKHKKSTHTLIDYKYFFDLIPEDIFWIDLWEFSKEYKARYRTFQKYQLKAAILFLKQILKKDNIYYIDEKWKEHNKKQNLKNEKF